MTSKNSTLSIPRLEFEPITLAELPIWFMARLYYRPVAVRKKLTAGETKRHEEGGGGSLYKFLYRHVWAAEETVVNKCLEAVLMAVPPPAVAAAVKAIAPGSELRVPSVCRLRARDRLNRYVGEPDFVLVDQERRALVLGEIKIGAKPTNGRYSLQQLQKYMQLGLFAQSLKGFESVIHLVVLPDADIAKHCSDAKTWNPRIGLGHRLEPEDEGRFKARYSLYKEAAEKVAENFADFDIDQFLKPVDLMRPLLPIDTYAVSWKTMCAALVESCQQGHAQHLVPALDVLRSLGEGSFGE